MKDSMVDMAMSQLDPVTMDLAVVFGEGPVKPILLKGELTADQYAAWISFKRDPISNVEPEFRVVERDASPSDLSNCLAIRSGQDSKALAQQSGRLALRRMGRQSALAAGGALFHGITRRILISGGHTAPVWAGGPHAIWPSEAELMRDIVKRTFGTAFQRRFGYPIDTVVDIESAATNTLENVVFAINQHPILTQPNTRVGLISAWHHMPRCSLIAEMFSIKVDDRDALSAQDLLLWRLRIEGSIVRRKRYSRLMKFMKDPASNEWLRGLLMAERRFIRGLTEDKFISYWFGYVFKLEDPLLIQRIVSRTLCDFDKSAALEQALVPTGVSIDELRLTRFDELAARDPSKFRSLKLRLAELTNHRLMPPLE